MKRWLWWGIVGLMLAGCGWVPARVPPQLAHTPGPAISFVDGHVVLEAFVVPVPPQWRVIKTSTAAEPLRVVLAAPDNAILITAALDARTLDNPALPIHAEQAFVHAAHTLYLVGQAADEAVPMLAEVWLRVVSGVRLR